MFEQLLSVSADLISIFFNFAFGEDILMKDVLDNDFEVERVKPEVVTHWLV